MEITVTQGKGRARITAGTETFDSGEVAVAQNQSWRIRLAAVKVKKLALTGLMDDASLKQAAQSQSTQSGRRFVYDEAGHLMGEYDASGKVIQEVVWLEDQPVAAIRPTTGGGTAVYYIHPDHLGTPRQITDAGNKIVWRWDNAEPFGANYPDEDPDGDGVGFEFNLRFPGRYYDRETGRHYNYFRDYDPATGRYMESDPIGLKGGMNRYAYVAGNPISRSDPKGKSAGGSVAIGAVVWGGGCALYAYDQAMAQYPNPRDDKKRHCYASCLLNKCTLWTFLPSFLAGWGFEELQGASGMGVYDPKDQDANLYGLLASYSGDCKAECNVCPIK